MPPADEVRFRAIGVIRTPFTEPRGTPIQGALSDARGTVELDPELEEGLRDVEGFSHLHLLYALHRSTGFRLTVVPFLDDRPHGVFATRAPRRPNALGMSVVRLLSREGRVLHVEGVDVLDGTPLLDVKPYVPRFDCVPDARGGWTDEVGPEPRRTRADDRFAEG